MAGIFSECLMTLSPPHSRKDVLALSGVCGALTEMKIVVIFGVCCCTVDIKLAVWGNGT